MRGRAVLPILILGALSIGSAQTGDSIPPPHAAFSEDLRGLSAFGRGVEIQQVLLIHGYNAADEASPGGMGTNWLQLEDAFSAWGWPPGSLMRASFYPCDPGEAFAGASYLDLASSGDHATHHGGPAAHAGSTSGCPEPTLAGESPYHDGETSVEHLGYHLAWRIFNAQQGGDRCFGVIGYSMGGLLIRYALAQVEAGHPEFPPALCVPAVVTYGSPHAGTDRLGLCTTIPCDSFRPGSDLMRWLETHAAHPDGTDGTRWLVMGSKDDDVVPALSAISLQADERVVYLDGTGVEHSPSGAGKAFIEHVSEERSARLTSTRGVGPMAERIDHWPVRWADRFLAFPAWTCGKPSAPVAIAADTVVTGEIDGVPCRFAVQVPAGLDDVVVEAVSPTGTPLALHVYADGDACAAGGSWYRHEGPVFARCHAQGLAGGETYLLDIASGTPRTTTGPVPFALQWAATANAAPTLAITDDCPASLPSTQPWSCVVRVTDDGGPLEVVATLSDEAGDPVWTSGASPTAVGPEGAVLDVQGPALPRGMYQAHLSASETGPHGRSAALPPMDLVSFDVPGPPASLTVLTASPGGLEVSWDPPVDDGGSSVSSYRLVLTGPQGNTGAAPTCTVVQAGGSSFTFTGLGLGEYGLAVHAVNAGGTGVAAESTAVPLSNTGDASPARGEPCSGADRQAPGVSGPAGGPDRRETASGPFGTVWEPVRLWIVSNPPVLVGALWLGILGAAFVALGGLERLQRR